MNDLKLLYSFAEEQGIDKTTVDKFLSKWDNPTTIEELLEVPEELLTHHDYISTLSGALRDFIVEDLEMMRYERINLESVTELLADHRGYEEENGKDEEKLKFYEEVEKQILADKFGSVTYD